MKRIALVCTVMAGIAAGTAGCSHIPFFGTRNKSPKGDKTSKYVATDTEKEFMARWVDRRSAELISQGQSAESAQAQAQKEFYDKFPSTVLAQQAGGQK